MGKGRRRKLGYPRRVGHPRRRTRVMEVANNQQTFAGSTSEQELHSRNPVAPLFILGVPRSYTSVVCAMLGQHAQMYGLPEMHLFPVETVGEWLDNCDRFPSRIEHGPLRAVAELIYGEQTQRTITQAQGWLRRRAHYTTGFLLEVLANRVQPRILVEKSPSIVRRVDFLQRAHRMFPEARFLHLVRHPRGQCTSVMNFIDRRSKSDHPPRWLISLAANRRVSIRENAHWKRSLRLDPQLGWYERNMNICRFLESVPYEQQMRVKGEDLLTNPNSELAKIALWVGLRSDGGAI